MNPWVEAESICKSVGVSYQDTLAYYMQHGWLLSGPGCLIWAEEVNGHWVVDLAIGENAVHVRERVCSGFEWLGIELDSHRNREGEQLITSDRSRCQVFVIRTDEEAIIAEAAFSYGADATAG